MKHFRINLTTTLAIVLSVMVLTAFAPTKNTYTVDPEASALSWTGKKVTGEHSGKIELKSGTLIMDGGKLTGGTFEVDMRSILVTDIEDDGMNKKLKGHLQSEDFFNVSEFTTATFKITDIKPNGKNKYDITGKATIKGISKDISFPAQVYENNGKVTAIANITIDRSQFNVKYGSGSFFDGLGDKMIYDDFYIDVKLVTK